MLKTLMVTMLLFSASIVNAKQEEPPYLRTGQDVVDQCAVDSLMSAYRCDGMIEALADKTEAKRWKDQCPPSITVGPGNYPPPDVIHMLDLAHGHPEWLKLSATEFVDKVERQRRCGLR